MTSPDRFGIFLRVCGSVQRGDAGARTFNVRLQHPPAAPRELIGFLQTKCRRESSVGDVVRVGPTALVCRVGAGRAAFRGGHLQSGRTDETCVLSHRGHHLPGNQATRRIAPGSRQYRARGHAGLVAHPGRRQIRAARGSPAVGHGVAAQRLDVSTAFAKERRPAPAAELLCVRADRATGPNDGLFALSPSSGAFGTAAADVPRPGARQSVSDYPGVPGTYARCAASRDYKRRELVARRRVDRLPTWCRHHPGRGRARAGVVRMLSRRKRHV